MIGAPAAEAAPGYPLQLRSRPVVTGERSVRCYPMAQPSLYVALPHLHTSNLLFWAKNPLKTVHHWHEPRVMTAPLGQRWKRDALRHEAHQSGRRGGGPASAELRVGRPDSPPKKNTAVR